MGEEATSPSRCTTRSTEGARPGGAKKRPSLRGGKRSAFLLWEKADGEGVVFAQYTTEKKRSKGGVTVSAERAKRLQEGKRSSIAGKTQKVEDEEL